MMTAAVVLIGIGILGIAGLAVYLTGWDADTVETRKVDHLIAANRAKPRPGMATRDDRLLREMATRGRRRE